MPWREIDIPAAERRSVRQGGLPAIFVLLQTFFACTYASQQIQGGSPVWKTTDCSDPYIFVCIIPRLRSFSHPAAFWHHSSSLPSVHSKIKIVVVIMLVSLALPQPSCWKAYTVISKSKSSHEIRRASLPQFPVTLSSEISRISPRKTHPQCTQFGESSWLVFPAMAACAANPTCASGNMH